jgi:acyl-coenzyme A thioesterase PaaI-like protein
VEGSEHDHGFLPALRTWHCFGCDPNHAKGLRLRFTAPAPDSLRSEFTLSDDYTGVGSIVHGGIIATIFDDVMMWCLLRHRRRFFVTTEMNQQLLRPALAGQPLRAEARTRASTRPARSGPDPLSRTRLTPAVNLVVRSVIDGTPFGRDSRINVHVSPYFGRQRSPPEESA